MNEVWVVTITYPDDGVMQKVQAKKVMRGVSMPAVLASLALNKTLTRDAASITIVPLAAG